MKLRRVFSCEVCGKKKWGWQRIEIARIDDRLIGFCSDNCRTIYFDELDDSDYSKLKKRGY
jgi:hypothetical protein